MSTTSITRDGKTVTISSDGETTDTAATTQQPAIVIHRHHGIDAGSAFFMGMIMGAFILWLLQREGRRRRHRPDPAAASVSDVSRDEVAALARRTATLEQIVTDPATRTAREIDALR